MAGSKLVVEGCSVFANRVTIDGKHLLRFDRNLAPLPDFTAERISNLLYWSTGVDTIFEDWQSNGVLMTRSLTTPEVGAFLGHLIDQIKTQKT